MLKITEHPKSKTLYMLCGWRQWADAGSVSSGLPDYLIQETDARRIATLDADHCYLFQIPGTHSLVRPIVRFDDGYPKSLDTPKNEFFFTGDDELGFIIFLGDEPHLNLEAYVNAILEAAKTFGIQRILSFAGVYGELPHNKERIISAIFSQYALKSELEELALKFSDYHGGASIGSVLCRRSVERDIEYVGLYAFVPTYELSNLSQLGNAIRVEDDYTAWLNIMRRINYMLKAKFDLTDLEQRSEDLIKTIDEKIIEIDRLAPQLNIKQYVAGIEDEFEELPFNPLADVWEDALRNILDEDDSD